MATPLFDFYMTIVMLLRICAMYEEKKPVRGNPGAGSKPYLTQRSKEQAVE